MCPFSTVWVLQTAQIERFTESIKQNQIKGTEKCLRTSDESDVFH